MAESELRSQERGQGPKTRCQRHLSLSGFGEAAQRRLKAARVLLVGSGGLGSPAAMYLAAAGIGHLTIVDARR